MANSYKLPLAVCDTNGKIIVATITPLGKDRVNLKLPELKAVIKDNADLAYEYNAQDHSEVVARVTLYLEALYLKELENESNNPGKHDRDKSTGTDLKTVSLSTGISEGKKSGSVHHSRRGRKPPNSDQRRFTEDDLAEVSDTESK
jgi:hypothetical protein